jgi:hypothetical protein
MVLLNPCQRESRGKLQKHFRALRELRHFCVKIFRAVFWDNAF